MTRNDMIGRGRHGDPAVTTGLSWWRLAAMTGLAAMLATGLPATVPARAQSEAAPPSFITPFPENDTYQISVIGDSLAEHLLDGLAEVLTGDPRQVLRKPHRPLSGLMRTETADELQALEDALKTERSHVIFIMIGAGDRRPLTLANGRRIAVGHADWREEYGRRVDQLIKILKRPNTAIYWVSQPIVRRGDWNDDVQMMNEIARERAFLNAAKYIDVYQGFADENGGYNAYGPDITGKSRLLRESDGVHFSWAGTRKLAHFVERDLKRDVGQAKSERAIPLVGGEIEQKQVAALRGQAAAPAGGWQGTVSPGADGRAGRPGPLGPGGNTAGRTGAIVDTGIEQKADNSRINLRLLGVGGKEETIALEILRPAISAAVVALVTRRESADKASQMGEAVADDIGSGMTVLSSVTLAAEGASTGKLRGNPAASTLPVYRVLIKGERLAPKPGRADDLRWPPQHEAALPEKAAPPAVEAPALKAPPRPTPPRPSSRS